MVWWDLKTAVLALINPVNTPMWKILVMYAFNAKPASIKNVWQRMGRKMSVNANIA